MYSYEENPYHHPEATGLTVVKIIEDPDASYSFETIALWRNADGDLLYAEDSGCSCPSPFEDATLKQLTDETWPEFETTVKEWCSWGPTDDRNTNGRFAILRTEMLAAAAMAL